MTRSAITTALTPDTRSARGFSLVEAVVSILIVGVTIVAAMNMAGSSRTAQYKLANRSRAMPLAKDLMAEILSHVYEEPDDPPEMGRESGESGGSRGGWDDVDDYHGWSASPPENSDGSVMADLTGWTRNVEVQRVDPDDLSQVSASETGIKRITVTVKRGDLTAASLVAIRTSAWPEQDNAPKVLFVVRDKTSPTAQEQLRQALMESWGFTVTLISDHDPQSDYDAAVADHDVAYVPEGVDETQLGVKLKSAAIGAVLEEALLADEFGIGSGVQYKTRDEVKILDTTHYITSFFSGTGYHVVYAPAQPVSALNYGAIAPGATVLGENYNVGSDSNNKASLIVLETGADLDGGGTAAGRRVKLPWADTDFDVNTVNSDGQELMKRTIEWAASKEQS